MRCAAEKQVAFAYGLLGFLHFPVVKVTEAVGVNMPSGICVHFGVSDFADLIHTLFIINDGVFNAHGIAAGWSCSNGRKNARDNVWIHVFIKKSTTGTAACHELFHIFAHLFRGKRQGILWLLAEDGDRPRRTNREAMLTAPAAPPAESFKFFHLWVAVRPEPDHHAGAGVDAVSAFDTFGFIDLKMCFLFCTHSVLPYRLLCYNDNFSIYSAFILRRDSFADVLKIKHLPTDRNQFLFIQKGEDRIHDLLRGVI